MTTLNQSVFTRSRIDEGRNATRLERLGALLVWIRSTAGEGFEVTVARSVDEAFASFARDFRR